MIYNLTVHYHNDPNDEQGYDDEIEAKNINEAKEQVKQIEDFKTFNYYVLESEDGEEYYNSSEEDGWEDW
jgi:hypothetical protein